MPNVPTACKPPCCRNWVRNRWNCANGYSPYWAKPPPALGKAPEADQHFRAALAEPRRDNYLLRVYSDFLISQQRPQEVITLLQDKTSDDALLLRLAIASRDAQQTADTARYQALLEARYQAAKLRGSTLHAEDEALYARTFGAAT